MNSSDQIYADLRQRILRGDWRSGAALKERDLCLDLNVSRTPVREALRRLCSEGLAENRPRRSIVVAQFEPGEMEEVFELGVMLESFIAGLAAEKATEKDVVELARIVDEMTQLSEVGAQEWSDVYVLLDQAFHGQLAEMARSPRITRILHQAISFQLLTKVFVGYEPMDFAMSLMQHRTILQAVTARNVEWASSAMRTHIRTGQGVGSKHPAAD